MAFTQPMARVLILFTVLAASVSTAYAEVLKPFIQGSTPQGGSEIAIAATIRAIEEQGFVVVGSYSPYSGAQVIVATHPDLMAAAASSEGGAYGIAQRIAVTEVSGELQVSYVNPAYLGTAYGMGKLEGVSQALADALGRVGEFGAKGIREEKLVPGKYHYKMMMPYFDDVHELNTFTDQEAALSAVEANLASGEGGTQKVYRIDLPESNTAVFGVAIDRGDGPEEGRKDTDSEIMEIIDYGELRSTAYLPYEIVVKDGAVTALHSRFRIAVHFPDTSMMGSHGFTAIMSSTAGIREALEAVAGKE